MSSRLNAQSFKHFLGYGRVSRTLLLSCASKHLIILSQVLKSRERRLIFYGTNSSETG